MGEDFAAQLDGYRLQLQQVEAAMLAEPDNNELNKLKKDLDEVIALTRELAQGSSADSGGSSTQIDWKVGDKCMAKSSKDGKYYDAVVDSIDGDQVAVTFISRKVKDRCDIWSLKQWVDQPVVKQKHVIPEAKGIGIWTKQGQKGTKSNWQGEKEKRRKKLQKRLAHVKELDAVKEKEKSKWQAFNVKAHTKNFKGVKKSVGQRETRESTGTEHLALARKVYNQSEYQRP